jgi:hypothetical protein
VVWMPLDYPLERFSAACRRPELLCRCRSYRIFLRPVEDLYSGSGFKGRETDEARARGLSIKARVRNNLPHSQRPDI